MSVPNSIAEDFKLWFYDQVFDGKLVLHDNFKREDLKTQKDFTTFSGEWVKKYTKLKNTWKEDDKILDFQGYLLLQYININNPPGMAITELGRRRL